MPIRVLIADDHPIYLDGLTTLLSSIPDIELVGAARSGEEALILARTHKPNVILMDIRMPGLNGIEAVRQILETDRSCNILMVTMYEDRDLIVAAMRAGARGYLLKGADQTQIMRAIQAVSNGEGIFSPGVVLHLQQYFVAPPASFADLTDREYEILALIVKNFTNAQIAEHLVLSPKTVRNHITSIFSKLQVEDRTQAIERAREAGIGEHRT